MKILVTGATGFIGKNLVKYLGSVGYEIETLSHLEFMNEDFHRLDCFYDVKVGDNGEHPDVVVHCAWPKLDLHVTDHLEFAEMTCNFYNECKKRGITVINIGSSSEYGVKFEPMREDMICEPINTYGIAKLMVTLYAKKLGFNTLRLFTVIGDGGHSFFDNLEKWDKWESPLSNRDTVGIMTVCKAVERLIHAKHLFGEIINIGRGVVKMYIDYDGQHTNIDPWFKAAQTQYEPLLWQADVTKMNKLLNV